MSQPQKDDETNSTTPATDERPKMTFMQRWALKQQLKRLNSELEKAMKQDKDSQENQKRKLLQIMGEMTSDQGVYVEEATCTCGTEDCTQQGRDHTKTTQKITNEQMQNWTVEKLQNTILTYFDELNIYIDENKDQIRR